MTAKIYNFDRERWEMAREQVKRILVRCARSYELIWYSDLVAEIDAIELDLGTDKDRAALGHLLGEISQDTDAEGIGLLSAMAVGKSEGMPTEGFFNLAKQLGHSFNDRGIFGGEQYDRVTKHYRNHR